MIEPRSAENFYKYSNNNVYREKFIYTFMFVNEFTYFFLLPYLSKSQSSAPLIIGGLLAASTVLESLFMLVMASYVRRISASTVFTLGAGLMVFAWAILLTIPGLIGICLFYVLMSLSKSVGKPYARSILLKTVPLEQHDRVFPNVSFVQNAAIVVAPIAGSLAITFGERAFLLPALVYILLFCLAGLLFYKPQIIVRNSGEGLLYGLYEVAQSHVLRNAGISICLAYVVMGTYITGTVLLPEYNLVLSPYIGWFFSVVGVTIVFWQGLLRRWVPLRIQTSSILLFLIAMCSSLFFISPLPAAFAAIVLYAIYESIIVPLNYKAASEGVSETSHSFVFSVFLVLGNIGQAIGAGFTGVLVRFTSSPAVVLSAFAMSATLSSIVFWIFIVRQRR